MKNIFYKVVSIILCVAMCLTLVCCAKTESPTVEPQKGKVYGKVLSNDGEMLIAGIIVIDQQNNSYRATTNAYGAYALYLLPGEYTLIFTKGIEFSTFTTTITIESLKTYYLTDVRLTQLYDSYAKGWIAGDFHQHSYYSDGIDSINQLVLGNAAAGLYFGYLTDHNTSRGGAEWRLTNGVTVLTQADGTKRQFNGFDGVEVTTGFGHIQSLGTGITFDKYELDFTESERSNPKAYARDKIIYIAEQIVRQGGKAQMNHPYSTTNMGLMNYLEEDDFEVFDLFDTMEIWNGYFIVPDGRFTNKNSENQNYTAKLLWYSTLNEIKNGHEFIAATGGSDNHDMSGVASSENRAKIVAVPRTVGEYYYLCYYSGKYSGVPTTYVKLNGEITQQSIAEATISGHSFVSNGPVVNCNVGDKTYGDTIETNDGAVTISTDIFNRDGLSQIRIVKNGEIVKNIEVAADTTHYDDNILLSGLTSQDWILIEVLGPWGQYAITNPIFIR